MKRLILAFLIVTAAAEARQRLQGYCEQGNQTVTTNSVASTTKVQRSYPSCTVTVYLTGTLTLATLYSDNSSTPLANPFTAASTGLWFFYAANGRYDVRLSAGGITTPFTLGDFMMFDTSLGVITSLNALTATTQTFATGTSGSDFNISSATSTHTFNLPTASSTVRGLLSSANWTTFNAKESALTFSSPLSRSVNTVSLTVPIGISSGGTGQTTALAAFNALSPLTTAGDMLVYSGSANVRHAAGTTGQCLKANTALTNKIEWGTCLPASPLTVSSGGTGASTLTGVLQGNGTSAVTAVVASSQLQELRRSPNVSATTYAFSSPKVLLASDFDFPAQQPGGSLTAAVGATATLTPCPLGVDGANPTHYVYITGGTGAAEAVVITGGTCTSGASTGTITFTPANNHTGAWTIVSATGGVQEGVCYLSAADNRVLIQAGTTTLNASVAFCGKTTAEIDISIGATLAGSGSLPYATSTSSLVISTARNTNRLAAGMGAVLDSSSPTITPTNIIHHVSNTGAITTITAPSGVQAGDTVILIPNAAFTTTTAVNIAIASTAVTNKTLVMTWDSTNSKWTPSY